MTLRQKQNLKLAIVGGILLAIVLMTIFALRGGMGNQEKVTYAQVRQLLEQQMVSRVSLEDNTVTLYLKEPQGGQSVLTYQIGNPDWFYQDFNDLIVEQKRQGIITDYDYPQGWVPPYWMSFIPWIVILVVFGLLWYFMFLRQAGAGGGGGGGGTHPGRICCPAGRASGGGGTPRGGSPVRPDAGARGARRGRGSGPATGVQPVCGGHFPHGGARTGRGRRPGQFAGRGAGNARRLRSA